MWSLYILWCLYKGIYLWVQYKDLVQVNLVLSKIQLVLKGLKNKTREITLPHLELLAVTIGVWAANFVIKEFNNSPLLMKRTLFTDSACVLHWLMSNKPLPLFVENRVKEIREEKDIVATYINMFQLTKTRQTSLLRGWQYLRFQSHNSGGMVQNGWGFRFRAKVGFFYRKFSIQFYMKYPLSQIRTYFPNHLYTELMSKNILLWGGY